MLEGIFKATSNIGAEISANSMMFHMAVLWME